MRHQRRTKMERRSITFLVLVLSQQADSHILATTSAGLRSRTSILRMQQAPEPFSTDCVHVFDANLGNGKQCQLALTRVSDDRRAKLALWRMLYEHEAGSDASKLARAEAELRATMELSTGPSSMAFGANLNAASMNEGEEHSIALVRVEGDNLGSQVMVIDLLLVSPTLPKQIRPALHSMVVQSLQTIGKAEGMSVRVWTDFGI